MSGPYIEELEGSVVNTGWTAICEASLDEPGVFCDWESHWYLKRDAVAALKEHHEATHKAVRQEVTP